MSYLTYQGKMIQQNHKYAIKISAPVGPVNKLTNFSNVSFDTYSSSGMDMSAVENPGTYGFARCNDVSIFGYGFTPGQWGTAQFDFTLTINSGNLTTVFYKNGTPFATSPVTYTGPGEYSGAAQIIPATGNFAWGFRSTDVAGVDFVATNCRFYTTDGTP